MNKLQLKPQAEHRRRTLSPWIFRDEIDFTQKQYVPGDFVEVQNSKGDFYAYGYMNAESQIAVRILTTNPKDYVTRPDFLLGRFLDAWRSRIRLGRRNSFRLIFSESDFVPGFIVDLYRIEMSPGNEKQVFAMQVLTAGAERLMPDKVKFFQDLVTAAHKEGLSDLSWDDSALVLRNDVRVREKEGLRVEEPRFLKSFAQFNPVEAKILLDHRSLGEPTLMASSRIQMTCDLFQGQKTGFFLDQHENIQRALTLARQYFSDEKKTLRILDLCCYVGHWSSHLVSLAKVNFSIGGKPQGMQESNSSSSNLRPVEIHLVDVSKAALDRAEINVKNQIRNWGLEGSASVHRHEGDVLNCLDRFDTQSFDIIITDPPGFIKAKKDIEGGKSAYIRLNTEALKLAAPSSLYFTCSCSGLLNEDEFAEVVSKSFVRSGRQGRWVMKGGPSFDHPALIGFSQSQYLKMFGFAMKDAQT